MSHVNEEVFPLLRTRLRTRALAAAATLVLGTGLYAGLGPLVSGASSHREAPLTAADPQIDGTDLYAFVSPDRPSTVTLVSNWIPFQEPAGAPNFYAWPTGVNHHLKIDHDGDPKPDLTYRQANHNHYPSPRTLLYHKA